MGFRIGERTLELTITSIRALEWDTMRPNFFLLVRPQDLQGFRHLYITSFRTGDGDGRPLLEFLRAWPTLTLISIRAIIDQLQTLIAQISLVLAAVYVLVILAGALILVTVVQNMQAERRQQVALLRALGRSRSHMRRAQWLEFALRGLLTGVIGALGAQFGTWALEVWVLEAPLRLHPWLWYSGPLAGVILVMGLGGVLAARHWQASPAALLRETG